MTRLVLAGALDPNFGWADGKLHRSADCPPTVPSSLRGAFACASAGPSSIRLVRDALGLNKLFWAPCPDEEIRVAARPWRLVESGCPFDEIRAVPCGTVAEIGMPGGRLAVASLDPPRRRASPLDGAGAVEEVAKRLRSTLDGYCQALATAHPRSRIYVCLSGGLDSTGVLMLAIEHFHDVVAVSFDLRRDHGPPSADRQAAQRLAKDFRLPLLQVTPSGDELLSGLDDVLKDGIDWRDFNVHAGLVNYALARAIAATEVPGDRLVLTGDLPNEFLVDYHAEELNGRMYYALPKLSTPMLQTVLVRGLDTSHREVGPFQTWSLPAVQVYAPAVDHYLELPDSFLEDTRRKDRLCRHLFGSRLPEYVYTRPKTRAQVGDVDVGRGVLGLCLDRGIDATALRRRFAVLHRVRDPMTLDRFIRAGRYRAAVPATTRVA